MIKHWDVTRDHWCMLVNWLNENNLKGVNRVHSNNVEEVFGRSMMPEDMVIVYSTSTPYCPNSKKNANRMNITFLDKVLSMLRESCMALDFWGEALTMQNIYLVVLFWVDSMVPPYVNSNWELPQTTKNWESLDVQHSSKIDKNCTCLKTRRPLPVGNIFKKLEWFFPCVHNIYEKCHLRPNMLHLTRKDIQRSIEKTWRLMTHTWSLVGTLMSRGGHKMFHQDKTKTHVQLLTIQTGRTVI